MTDETKHIATAAASLDDPYATPHCPNRKTEAAIRSAQAGEGVRVESVDALFADLNDDEQPEWPSAQTRD